MKLFTTILFIGLLASCSKDTNPPSPVQGIWIEKTLRLDTLDFDKISSSADYSTTYFGSKSFIDTSLNPKYPIINTTFFYYYLKTDSIYLRNFFSSSLSFQPYKFQISSDQKSLLITKFYTRTGLTLSILEFDRIK